MVSYITNGIKVEVNTEFLREISNMQEHDYLFSYDITITNDSDVSVQLVSRFWKIFDSTYDYKFVEGEGVVGNQPILLPGESYTYSSGCNLQSEVGYMQGYYMFKQIYDDNIFRVLIPRFELIVPEKLN